MSSGGYAVEVTGLSPKATEKDVHDFFAFSGSIDHVEIVRSGECACTAYVTFKDSYSQETACLLSGATIIDQAVCITRWGHYQDEFDFWNRPRHEEETDSSPPQGSQNVPSAGEVVTMAQEVVKTMLSKGFVLGKDALAKAKSMDDSHQVSASAAARVTELSQRFGLADKICAGVGALLNPWMRGIMYQRSPNWPCRRREEKQQKLQLQWRIAATFLRELFGCQML